MPKIVKRGAGEGKLCCHIQRMGKQGLCGVFEGKWERISRGISKLSNALEGMQSVLAALENN